MHPVVGEVAHQIGPHVDAGGGQFGAQGLDLQAQHLVEDDLLFKDAAQAVDELGLELPRNGCVVFHGTSFTGPCGSWGPGLRQPGRQLFVLWCGADFARCPDWSAAFGVK